jgi:dienelactone hydrolase
MSMRDYYGAGAKDVAAFMEKAGIAKAAVDSATTAPVYATLDAPVAAGSRPVLLVAHGNGQDRPDQAILSEYLASWGYVVASVPSPMIATPMTAEREIPAFAERQTNALELAKLGAEQTLGIRAGGVAVVGHSFGARPALLYAMRHADTKAIVSLDGGIGTATGVDAFKSSASFRPDAKLPPLLHLYETQDAFMAPDSTLLRSLHFARREMRLVPSLHHIHFTTLGFQAVLAPDVGRVTGASSDTRRELTGAMRSVRAFLERELPPSPAAKR